MNTISSVSATIPHSIQKTSVQPEIILDLSRLLSRVLHPTPTGIDRVEMAYARELLKQAPDRLHFAAVHKIAGYGRLRHDDVLRFLDETKQLWAGLKGHDKTRLRLAAARKLLTLCPRPLPTEKLASEPVYLLASPNNLDKPDLVAHLKT